MHTIGQWFEEYAASHRHPRNERLHWICVPAIVLSVFGLLEALPQPKMFAPIPWLNWGVLAVLLLELYYLRLSLRLALGAAAVFAIFAIILQYLQAVPIPFWLICAAIFVLAWIGQFVGHAIEGHRPSFFQDLQFLLIGPLWVLSLVYRRLGIRY